MGLHIHYKVMWCGVGVFVGRVPNTVLEPKKTGEEGGVSIWLSLQLHVTV